MTAFPHDGPLSPAHERHFPISNRVGFALIFLLIFLPAFIVTKNFEVFQIFINWVYEHDVWYLDEVVSMLILCILPFLVMLSFRLYQLNGRLNTNEKIILGLSRQNELILNAAGDGIFGLDRSGRTTFINPSAARMMGRPRKRLLDKSYKELVNPVPDTIQPGVAGTRGISATFDKEKAHSADDEYFQNHDGTWFPVEYTSTPIHLDGRMIGVVVTFRDISQRKKTEAELDRLAAAIRQTADMILITDPRGRVQYVNPAFERVSEYGHDEVVGKPVSILRCDQQTPQFYQKMVETLLRGEVWKDRFITRRKSGVLLNVDMTVSPIRDRRQRVIHYVGVVRDVTREVELGRLLRQSQRLEAVGTLAGGIAHDFNNILTAILSYTDLTMEEIPEGEMAHDNLKEVMIAGERARELIRQLMAFSRRGEGERTPLSLQPVVKEAIKLLQAVLPANVEIRHHIEPTDWQVMSDATQIHQVVMNLSTNAAQAMWDREGLLEIQLEPFLLDETGRTADPQLATLPPGPYLVLTVRDNGVGIPPEIMERIFEPFFTTKGIGKGTGLGLSMVHGIVQNHRGTITVRSQPGEGSTFRVHLPAMEQSTQTAQAGEP